MPSQIPLLLIPGLLCDAALWQHQVKHLKNVADCHVAVVTRHDRMEDLARAVLVDAPPQFALAGLSMGGYVALEIMRQASDRVIKLALLDTSARADTSDQRTRRQLLLSMSKQGQFKGVTPRLLPMLIRPERLDDMHLTDVIMAMAERVGREAFHNQQTAILNRIDSQPYLKDIKCPTLVLGGRQDALTPPDIMHEIAEGIKGARHEVIEECGHLAPLEQPEQVNYRMENWLRG